MERTYWVDSGGSARGPYGIEQMVELARRGALRPETPVRIDGEEEDWQQAASVPELRPLVSHAVPETVVMASSPLASPSLASPPPRERRAPRWILGVPIGLALGGAIAAALVLAGSILSREPAVPEAVLEEGVPSHVRSMTIVRLYEDSTSEAERTLAASLMASLCGGVDLGARLLDARGRTPRELESDGTLALLQRSTLREELACGERLAGAADAGMMVLMSFEDGEARREVGLMQLGDVADPPFPQRHSFSGLEGRCHPAEESAAQCAGGRDALVRRGGSWAFGTADDVAAYAREWNRGAERTETTNMEYARLLASALHQSSIVTSVQIRPEALPFVLMCGSVPGGVDECLPDDIDDAVTRIMAEIRGVSVEVRRPTGAIVDPELRWAMTFAARDEDDAGDAAREVEALLQDWRAHLENAESVLIERIRSSEERDADHAEAMLRAFVRAMQSARVETDGRLASIVADAELSEAEQREVLAYLATVREEREAAARVVHAVQSGEAPARADLARLVGDPAAEWMLAPRASEQSCARVRGRLEQLAAGGVATSEFGAQFRLQERFAGDRCAGMVMPQAALECLTGAASIAAMERCALPRPPWERQPIARTIQGELTDGDAIVQQDGSRYDEHTIEVDAGWILRADLESSAFDAYLWLIGPEGRSLVQDDDGGGGTNSRIEHTASSGGTYTLRANGYNAAGRGPYTLRIDARPSRL